MIDNIQIGKRIKQRREETGTSVIMIAEATGLTRATIYKYENGEIKQVKLAVVESIAICLKCNPSWLIGVSEEKFLPSKSTKINRSHFDISQVIDDVLDYISSHGEVKYNMLDLTPKARKMIVNDLTELKNKIDKLYGFDD